MNVNLVFDSLLGECVASTPKPGTADYEIRTSNKGDTITWRVVNNCAPSITVGISGFRAARKNTSGSDELIDPPMVESLVSLTTGAIARGSTGQFVAHTKPGISHHGRPCATTYVYDLEEITSTERKVIADPQIEVPK